ncbi:hypothetical protein GCM10010961_06540 [Pseudodonghicola xiamenensis]|uniref:Uncharacterized protein n=1 Tax=Pseudodonghicola xiamenensis TaxID=337702 RepID=A0A8J3MC26_9RHOB|nr:hypothetical protein GCM10010961_06540 [Pseudodonghicola xiamenensis]
MHLARLDLLAKDHLAGRERPYADHVIPQEGTKPVKTAILAIEMLQPVVEGAESTAAHIRSATASIG